MQRLLEAGCDLAVWDITSDLGVPAFHCVIVDAVERDGHPGTGTGCHPDKNVALLRALFEAVQVRAIYIWGDATISLAMNTMSTTFIYFAT